MADASILPTKNISVLMPSLAGQGRRAEEFIIGTEPTHGPNAVLPEAKRRLSILKYKEIEYLINERISRDFRVKRPDGESVAYRLTADFLESGCLLEGDLDQVRNSDVIIAYIGNPPYYTDTVDVIYELALRNVLRPELILLGELEGEEEGEEERGENELARRVGVYLRHYIRRNVAFNEDAPLFQLERKLATEEHYPLPLDGYHAAIPDSLSEAIKRGWAAGLEKALTDSIGEAITTPPKPTRITEYFESLDPQRLVSTSTPYLPSSVVKVTFGPQYKDQKSYGPEQLKEVVVCDCDPEFKNLYAFRDADLTGPIDDKFLFSRLKEFVDEDDLQEFTKDQAELFESIVYRPGVGSANVPLRINANHPLEAYRNREFLPSTILRKRIGDLKRDHSYLLLVVYSDLARWRQRIEEMPPKPRWLRAIPTAYDEDVVRITFGRQVVPKDWSGRVLYLGDEGARAWLDLCHGESYILANDQALRLREMRREAVAEINLQTETIVSFGPGDGENDVDVVERIANILTKVRYIPVEISTGLLAVSLQRLQGIVDIAVALLGDFESGLRQVEKALYDYARPKPAFFSLLGGTLGNLDHAGASFLGNLRQIMQLNDTLLMDVPLAGPAWAAAQDPRMDPAKYDASFRRFLAGGLTRIDDDLSLADYESWFDGRIECACQPAPEIPDTHVITIRDRKSRRTLLRLNRFRWETLLPWLEQRGFAVRYQRNSLALPGDTFGMGVVLLERHL